MLKQKRKKEKFDISEDIKSDFITVASHQLRTPISAVRWSLDALLSGKAGELSKKQKEITAEAYKNNSFMVKVVNDLLRIARIEEKGISLVPEFASLKIIVQEVIKKQKDFAKACNCQINVAAEKELPKAYIDPLQVKVVINGLINNAVRYSRGQCKIEINLKKNKSYLIFKIKDNGIGIPAKQQELVFSKFFRGTNAMKAQSEGMGLDLYLMKKIVDASDGMINFVSKENRGTTFTVYLPIAKKEFELSNQKIKENPENLLKKEREFVAITIHELKAPLGVSKWSLEILKNGKAGQLNKDQNQLIEQIYRGNERLLVLVRDLLNLAKIQEGEFDIKPKRLQLEKVINEVMTGFRVAAKQKNINLRWKKTNKLLPRVNADQNRIAQVLTNIISNAVKYTPEKGRVLIEVKRKTGADLKKINDNLDTANISFVDNKKGYLVVSVQDTGMGISKAEQKKMFTRFFRSKKVLKTGAEGTGLGLYITKSIVNLHNGDIWFASRLSEGSTFYFSLAIA